MALGERIDREREREEQSRQTREAILRSVHHELESNAAQLNHAATVLRKKKDHVPVPLFDVSVWPIVSSMGVFATLKPETATALMHAYNRMGSANDQHAILVDLSLGPTSILVAMGAAPTWTTRA